jgi:hypothetical protein
MKITVLTICSVNYLSQAKTLGDSLLQHHPEYNFVIGLVDRIDGQIDSSSWYPYNIIEVEKIEIPNFNQLWKKYDIVELNTCVKPFFMEYILNQDQEINAVVYLDPDIFVYNKLDKIEEKLKLHSIILTPHIIKPNRNVKDPVSTLYERILIQVGIYNLGFLAVARNQETSDFLNWWKARLEDYCFRYKDGLFVDQKWINIIPIYYQGVHIERHMGCNVAHWNIWERKITSINDEYYVNSDEKLLFFHFSSYNPLQPQRISKQDEIKFSEYQELMPLFDDYGKKLLKNNYQDLINIKCYFSKQKEEYQKALKNQEEQRQNRVIRMARKSLRYFIDWLVSLLSDSTKNLLRDICFYTIEKVELSKQRDK